MADVTPPPSRPVQLRGSDKVVLIVELLVFALPCYLIYAVCLLLAVFGIGTFFSILMDVVTNRGGEPLQALRGMAPFAIASATAFLGLPALVMAANLLIRVFRGSVSDLAAKAVLARTSKWAALPLAVMSLILIRYWPRAHSPHWLTETLENAVFYSWVSGLPLLIPALHLRHILTAPSAAETDGPRPPDLDPHASA